MKDLSTVRGSRPRPAPRPPGDSAADGAADPPRDGRDARGEDTRRRLLAAGLRVFGARGFDAVGTREIAQAAGVNQAAILYHFGGKDQLYLGVAELVAERGRGMLQQIAAAGDLGDALRALVRGLLAFAGDEAAVAFVLREQAEHGPGFDVLYARYLGPVHERISALVGAATGRDSAAAPVLLDAHALVGMVLGFAVARATLLRRLGRPAYTPEDVEAIAARVADLGTRAVGGRAPTPAGSADRPPTRPARSAARSRPPRSRP